MSRLMGRSTFMKFDKLAKPSYPACITGVVATYVCANSKTGNALTSQVKRCLGLLDITQTMLNDIGSCKYHVCCQESH